MPEYPLNICTKAVKKALFVKPYKMASDEIEFLTLGTQSTCISCSVPLLFAEGLDGLACQCEL